MPRIGTLMETPRPEIKGVNLLPEQTRAILNQELDRNGSFYPKTIKDNSVSFSVTGKDVILNIMKTVGDGVYIFSKKISETPAKIWDVIEGAIKESEESIQLNELTKQVPKTDNVMLNLFS
jgi:hypothetical protein